MFESLGRGRGALNYALALVCTSVACNAVLDIEDPKLRPDGGEGGDSPVAPSGGQTNAAGGASTLGGSGAGAGGASPSEGGAGDAGDAGSGGEGGYVTLRDCETDSVRCTDKTPEVCDTSGHWVPNTAAANGDCAVLCEAGKCVECLST